MTHRDITATLIKRHTNIACKQIPMTQFIVFPVPNNSFLCVGYPFWKYRTRKNEEYCKMLYFKGNNLIWCDYGGGHFCMCCGCLLGNKVLCH